MAIEVIPASTPTTVVPPPEMTYDKWHMVHLGMDCQDPNQGARLEVRFRKGFKDPDTGVWSLAPRSDDTVKELKVDDLLALAGENEGVETVMNGVLQAVTALATAQGLL